MCLPKIFPRATSYLPFDSSRTELPLVCAVYRKVLCRSQSYGESELGSIPAGARLRSPILSMRRKHASNCKLVMIE